MIDVIFQLLIFFLCVSQVEKSSSQRLLDLPTVRVSTSEVIASDLEEPVVVSLLANGEMEVDGRSIAVVDLAPTLETIAKRRAKSPEVWIRADRRIAYGKIEPVLAACAQLGLAKVAFKVMPKSKAPIAGARNS